MYLSYPTKTSGFLVKQSNYTRTQIGFQDSIKYFSPMNPIQIELYAGKLDRFEDILCGVRGLRNIAKAINNYNKRCRHRKMKIGKPHMRLKMIKYRERKLTIPHIWKIVYSNKLVLGRMNIRPKPFRINGSPENINFYRTLILRYLVNQSKLLKALFKMKIPKKLATIKEKELVERYSQLMDQKMTKMEKYVKEGRYDKMFLKQEKITLGRVNEEMLKLQRHPKNILFMIAQEYFIDNSRCHILNQNLEGIMFSFFKKLSNELKKKQLQNKKDTVLDKDLEDQLKEIHGLCDGFALESNKIIKTNKASEKRFKQCYGRSQILQKLLTKGLGNSTYEMKDQIFKFVQVYINEPSMYKTLKKYDLLMEGDLIKVERFKDFFRYIGQNVSSLFNDKSYSVNLFLSVHRKSTSKHQLI